MILLSFSLTATVLRAENGGDDSQSVDSDRTMLALKDRIKQLGDDILDQQRQRFIL